MQTEKDKSRGAAATRLPAPELLRSPHAVWLLPLATGVLGVVLWLAWPPVRLMESFKEEGFVETSTAVLFFVLALAVWLTASHESLGVRWALSVMFAAGGARELDLHRAFTDGSSVLKVSFYLRDAPLNQKLTAFIVLFVIAVAAGLLIARYARPFLHGVRRRDALAITVLCFFVTMIVSKVFDRSINVLAEDFDLHVTLSAKALVSVLEESLELCLTLLAVIGMAQHRRRAAAAVATPAD